MHSISRGYMGKILRVDLKNESDRIESLDEKVAFLLLGGKGLGIWLLYKSTQAHVDPLSPDNPVIFATGPLTGTLAPNSRFCSIAKSPATGAVDDSYCGGFFGPELKFAGYDALVVLGQCSNPTVLVIDDGDVRFESAQGIWGKSTFDTERILKNKLGKDFKIVEIGTAGERCSPIAGVFSEGRCAGRGGIGAVMGSKRLKAVAVRGKHPVRVCDPQKFEKMTWIAYRALRMNEVTVRSLPEFGTSNILLTINETGALPTRNFQTGRFQGADEISGEAFREKLWEKDFACSMGCTIKCSKIAFLKDEAYKGIVVDGPDYETVFSLGSNCGVDDVEAISYANYLCDLYGIDTISTGNIVGFLMELYGKGFISREELEGIDATWGNSKALINLVRKIGEGEGIGSVLQLGVKKLSERYKGSEDFAMHVKGLEMPAYEPRAAQGMGLCYAVSERGACHLRAYTAGAELLGYGGGADPRTYDRAKVQLAVDRQDEKAVVDSSVLCFFTLFGMKLKELYQMIVSCTGFNYRDVTELKRLGARVITLARLYNAREGLDRKDDTLPKRSLMEPLTEGPSTGQVVHLEQMLNDYYELRGWDSNGDPTKETIKELQLDAIL